MGKLSHKVVSEKQPVLWLLWSDLYSCEPTAKVLNEVSVYLKHWGVPWRQSEKTFPSPKP